jgi:hypothetical protein
VPGDFEIEYTQQSLRPDEVIDRLNTAAKPEFFRRPDGSVSAVALNANILRIGPGGTVYNGQVILLTPQGPVLTTVTKNSAGSIASDGTARIIHLERP